MWPRYRILLSVMVLGAIIGGLVQWQLLRLQEIAQTPVAKVQSTLDEMRTGSVVISKTDDRWYAPVLQRAAERQLLRRQQPCVAGICQDI